MQTVFHSIRMVSVSTIWEHLHNHVLHVYAQVSSGSFCVYVEPEVDSVNSTKPLVEQERNMREGVKKSFWPFVLILALCKINNQLTYLNGYLSEIWDIPHAPKVWVQLTGLWWGSNERVTIRGHFINIQILYFSEGKLVAMRRRRLDQGKANN